MGAMRTKRGISVIERVLSKIDIVQEGCWHWQGIKDKDGYGRLSIDGKSIIVHRYIYQLETGVIEKKMVLHHCDNPSCVRPSHLFSGTAKDNAQDREVKGRGNPVKGEDNKSHYLTTKQVLEIRRLWEASDKSRGTKKQIADKLGISAHLVGRIIRRDRWAWL